VLDCDLMPNHATPDTGSRCPWTPKHSCGPSMPTHLYTMPGTCSVHTASDLEDAYALRHAVRGMVLSAVDEGDRS
jgi:hypothetical protein